MTSLYYNLKRVKRSYLHDYHDTQTVVIICVSITTLYIMSSCLVPKHVLCIYYDNKFTSDQTNTNRSASNTI